MKVAVKTLKKIVFEITKRELEAKGFDEVWDSIRTEYPEDDYDILAIERVVSDEDVMFFELTPKASV